MKSKYKCPGCGARLTVYAKTIFDCTNSDCIMLHAILDKEQWLYLIENLRPINKDIPNASKRPTAKAR